MSTNTDTSLDFKVIHIDKRINSENIKKINDFIKEILSNEDNQIEDQFEHKFENTNDNLYNIDNNHNNSNIYETLNNNTPSYLFHDKDREYVKCTETREDLIREYEIDDQQIREMFESIYNKFIDFNNNENNIERSNKSLKDILDTNDEIFDKKINDMENKIFDDYYKIDFNSNENKEILYKIVRHKLRKMYKCSNDVRKLIINNNISKDEIYSLRGWFYKDNVLKKKMNKHNSLGTCIYCIDNFTFDEITYFYMIPYKNSKINNIQTNNLYCVCNKCYNSIGIKSVVNPPKTINDMKLIIYSKYGNIYEYNHNLIYAKTYLNHSFELSKLKKEYDSLVHKLSYYKYINQNIEEEIKFEKYKHNFLKQLVDKNRELITNYFYFVHSVEQNNFINIQNVRSNINDIIESKIRPARDKIECKICWDKEVSLILPCGHTICKDCYDQIKPNSSWLTTINCPHCRSIIHQDSVKPFFIS